jgi:hypothetical protein
MRTCSCGGAARFRFSRPLSNGRFARLDRCDDCTAEFLGDLNAGPGVTWTVEPLTDDLLASHRRTDSRSRHGAEREDVALLAFGEW